jgi:hypothetical protein
MKSLAQERRPLDLGAMAELIDAARRPTRARSSSGKHQSLKTWTHATRSRGNGSASRKVPTIAPAIMKAKHHSATLMHRTTKRPNSVIDCAWCQPLTDQRGRPLASRVAADPERKWLMTDLSDDVRRALNVLVRHSDGCDEAVLLGEGFTIRLLAGLVIDGFATGTVARIALDGRNLSSG